MREYSIEIKNPQKAIYPAPISMGGESATGDRLEIGNYYLKLNGKPFFAICGEMHFSRVEESQWEDEIIRMKMGGVNIISTYIFWIHHEEFEGVFDWSGNKNLRKFVELCQKHRMYVILRIGPFNHGEVRNGGFPDWLFGRPFDLRCNSPEYLRYTQRLFEQIGRQIEGLLFKDGGPIIGTQIENEYEHASAPWEMTTENSGEWTPSGYDGEAHMKTLKQLAVKAGIVTPLYTATAWGGACAPVGEVFPLWGGYAFRPWMFYGDIKEHPATTEYLFGDFHNNQAPDYYNFDPKYPKEDLPFACCEMGGGMSVFYKYRFQLPYESVSAMAVVKTASGCNFLGYYMFHGGTNPTGAALPYLNENALPKFSYDYQAAIGEFGQLRDSYRLLKLQHLFYKEFESTFCNTKTFLPAEAAGLNQHDTKTLRYAVRIGGDGSGFLFLNNYQDHVSTEDQRDFAVSIQTEGKTLRIPQTGGLTLKKDCSCILPFRFPIGAALLQYAAAQLITRIQSDGTDTYFFYIPEGMSGEFRFSGTGITSLQAEHAEITHKDNAFCVVPEPEQTALIRLSDTEGYAAQLCVLTAKDSMNFWKFRLGETDYAVVTAASVLPNGDTLSLEYEGVEEDNLKIFPAPGDTITVGGRVCYTSGTDGVFRCYPVAVGKAKLCVDYTDASSAVSETELKRPVVGSPITSTKIVNARASLRFQPEDFSGLQQLLLKVDYVGDIGYAFINGHMIHDNFCNGAPWEIGLMKYKSQLTENGMYLYISPSKKGRQIRSDSAMAARFEVAEEQTAKINSIWAVPVYKYKVELGIR